MITYLLRHGETNASSRGLYGRTPGIELNQKGREQAEKIALHLQNETIAAIYSSPSQRAIETAAPLAFSKQIPVQTSPAFNEVDQGDWTGKSWRELSEDPRWRLYNTYRSGTSCPNGEMAIEVQARAVRELTRLLDSQENQQIAVVSHADVIRAILCYYAGIPLDLSLRLEIALGSISVMELRRDGARILELNRTV